MTTITLDHPGKNNARAADADLVVAGASANFVTAFLERRPATYPGA